MQRISKIKPEDKLHKVTEKRENNFMQQEPTAVLIQI
jgi:hypothetical protein